MEEEKEVHVHNNPPTKLVWTLLIIMFLIILCLFLWCKFGNQKSEAINGDLHVTGNLIVDGNVDVEKTLTVDKIVSTEIVTQKIEVTSPESISCAPTSSKPVTSTVTPVVSPPATTVTVTPTVERQWVKFNNGSFTLKSGFSANTGQIDQLLGVRYSNVVGQIYYVINATGNDLVLETVGGSYINETDLKWLVSNERSGSDWNIVLLVINTNNTVTTYFYYK